jgi:hypothetical protein
MINNNMLAKAQNLTLELTGTIWKYVSEAFSNLNFEVQNDMIDNILFKMDIFTNINNATIFLNNCFEQTGGFEKYNFMKKFNAFIKATSEPGMFFELTGESRFDKFYNVLIPFCTPKPIGIPQVPTQEMKKINYTYQCRNLITDERRGSRQCLSVRGHESEANGRRGLWISHENVQTKCKECNGNVTISEYLSESRSVISRSNDLLIRAVDGYLMALENQINDQKYILYNKLQILKYLFGIFNINAKQTYHFKENKLKGNTILEHKIINHPKYNELERKFYDKLICELIVPFDQNSKYENLTFMSIDEVLYKCE